MSSSDPAQIRANTNALTGVRSLAFLNIASGHFVFLMDKALYVDLIGNALKSKLKDPLVNGVFYSGGAAVSLFFILSGYVMAVGYSKRDVSKFAKKVTFAKEFYLKRMARLLPIYYIALLSSIYWALPAFRNPEANDCVSPTLSLHSNLIFIVSSGSGL